MWEISTTDFSIISGIRRIETVFIRVQTIFDSRLLKSFRNYTSSNILSNRAVPVELPINCRDGKDSAQVACKPNKTIENGEQQNFAGRTSTHRFQKRHFHNLLHFAKTAIRLSPVSIAHLDSRPNNQRHASCFFTPNSIHLVYLSTPRFKTPHGG